MTQTQWNTEVAMAIKASGKRCKIFATGSVPHSSTFFAQIDNERAAAWLQINLSTSQFPTVEARKAEIVRQLSN